MDHLRGTDQQLLRNSQYRDATNLDARMAIYAFGEPAPTLQQVTIAIVGDALETKRVLDVGCGPGNYAPTFTVAATYVGFDLSRGMLEESRVRNGATRLAVADGQRLPAASASFDVVLAMHMLYHVPDRALAIAELARVVQTNGVVLVATNARDHQIETSEVIADAYARVVGSAFTAEPVGANFPLDEAPSELGVHFACTTHPLRRALIVPTVEPVLAYIASLPDYVGITDDVAWDAFIACAAELIQERITLDGAFRITAASGVIECRPL